MKRSITILNVTFVLFLFLFGLFSAGVHLYADTANPDIMKLSEIKPGMEGEGRTIFKGTRIETFKFKVLGIIENFAPDKNLIIVELLDSPVLNEAGIIQGMSGSPVYIDGKIIGAVAYGFGFSKKPIGGVTPIEDIIKTDDYNNPVVSVDIDVSNINVKFDKENNRRVAEYLRKELIRRVNYSPQQGLSPIQLIGINRGMDPAVISSYFNPIFSPASAGLAAGWGQSKSVTKESLKNVTVDREKFEVSPADACAVPLIRGDFEYSASGTVTYVKGNKVYLFGHPFFNLGTVEFPLHKAEVITVVPSFQTSFKMAATRNMIGTVMQDRFSAIQGELGREPYMIPMKVFLENRSRSFNLEMISQPLLTPVLGNIALTNIFATEYKQFGFQSLLVNGKIFIENEKNIVINDLFSGPNASNELGNLVLAITYFLMNNRDRHIKIQKMDFNISGTERIRNTSIENVILDKRSYNPGELINVSIHLKNERGSSTVETLQIKAPNLKAGSEFHLMVAGRDEIVRFENKNVKSNYFPEKLNDLIRAINNLRKNNRVYLKLMTPVEGVYIKGHEYSNLPAGMQNIFSFNTSSDSQSVMRFSTVTEYQYPVPSVVTGIKVFKLKIKARSNLNVQ